MVAHERRVARYHDVEIPLDELEALCRTYHVRELALFGSVLRDDFRPGSDVDVLVEFEPGASISFVDLSRLQRALATLLHRDVDVVTKRGLHHLMRDDVLAVAEVVYAA